MCAAAQRPIASADVLRAGGRPRAGADRPAFRRRGGRLMLDGIFVFDNAIHCYDMSDANLREDRADAAYSRDLLLARRRRRPLGRVQRRLDRVRAQLDGRGAHEMVFVDSPTDMAMAQVVPIFDWYRDSVRTGPDAARDGRALPGQGHVLRRRRPALRGRGRPRSSSSIGRSRSWGPGRSSSTTVTSTSSWAATTARSPIRCTSAAWSSASRSSSSTRGSRSAS